MNKYYHKFDRKRKPKIVSIKDSPLRRRWIIACRNGVASFLSGMREIMDASRVLERQLPLLLCL